MTDTVEQPKTMKQSRFWPGVKVWIAVLIFAASGSIVGVLTRIGEQSLVNGHNPISSCNVLFVGNLIAAMILLTMFRKDWNRAELKELSRGDWFSLTLMAILSGALAPALSFTAIAHTSVTNVVLVSRIEPLATMFLTFVILGQRSDRWTVAGLATAFCGVVTAFVLRNGLTLNGLGIGEVYALSAALTLACATIIAKQRLKVVSLGVFTVFRTFVGAIVFFIAATYLYGWSHFMEAFTPLLWKWMIVYGGCIIVAGQLLWFSGIQQAAPSTVSIAASFNPVAGLCFAFLILGETPDLPLMVGASVIICGIVIGVFGQFQNQALPANAESTSPESDEANQTNRCNLVELDQQAGFRGV